MPWFPPEKFCNSSPPESKNMAMPRRRRRPQREKDILVSYQGTLRRSPRFAIASNPNDGFHKEETESAAMMVSTSILRCNNCGRPPRIAGTLREKDSNQTENQRKKSSLMEIDNPVKKSLRRSPRFSLSDETRLRNCDFSEEFPRRTYSRFQHAIDREESRMNERNGIVGGTVVSKGKDGRTNSRVVSGDANKVPFDKPPSFARKDQIKTLLPRRRFPRFVHCISDEDNKENAGSFVNVSEENSGMKEANGSRAVRRSMKEKCENNDCERDTRRITKVKDDNSGVKPDEQLRVEGQTSSLEEEHGDDRAIKVGEEPRHKGRSRGRMRKEIPDSSACKGIKKRQRKENGGSKREAYEESETDALFLEEIRKRNSGTLLGSSRFSGWSQDQEDALERAYLIAKPSPHFWKEIAKLVPGKSAKECFDRIHAIVPTPPSQQPRSRLKRKFSPLGKSILTGNGPSIPDQFGPKGRISGKRKSLLAHRLVRNILRKHGLANDSHEVSGPSVLGGSFSLDKDFHQTRRPTTPICPLKSNCHEMSGKTILNNRKKLEDTITDVHQQALLSPEILKKVTNLEMHEKYIDRLHIREQTRCRKAAMKKRDAVVGEKKVAFLDKTETLKSARSALLSDAKDVFKQILLGAQETETFSEYEDDNHGDDCEQFL